MNKKVISGTSVVTKIDTFEQLHNAILSFINQDDRFPKDKTIKPMCCPTFNGLHLSKISVQDRKHQKLMSMTLTYSKEDKRLSLSSIVLDASYQRRGIGTDLFKLLMTLNAKEIVGRVAIRGNGIERIVSKMTHTMSEHGFFRVPLAYRGNPNDFITSASAL